MMKHATLYFRSVGDLLARYGRAFVHAWRERRQHDAGTYRRGEAEFLPAALSLVETPPSAAPRVVLWLLMAFAAIALLWSIFGKMDIVASAQGKIVPNDRTKLIQPLETSKVTAIHVIDGQVVKAGDVLIELDPTAAQADQQRLKVELVATALQIARARAMIAAIEQGHRPSMARPENTPEADFLDAARLLDGHYAEYASRRVRIEADLQRRTAERQSTLELVRKLERTVPLAQQRANDFKTLVEKNFVSKHGYYEREQARIEQEADLATQRSRLNEIDAAIREARSQLAALSAETRRIQLDSLNEAQQRLAALEQELRKADMRATLTRLVAPVDGTVQQLAIHTVGGVVTEAQPLMIVVPSDNPVEIEAFLENKDIGFVTAGQAATVKVETFLYTKYGTLDGTVMAVSGDAINDEKRGLIYAARVRLERAVMNIDGREVRLSPGMAVTVEVKTGRRRVIEYFLSPLMVYGAESLRER
ncbi:MAG: HlyD family type I secretion periplasmic adaptor subunit [Cupriavidus sp.]|nr:HlyD family type I secretion periplasmic adaptor subunit [Cupriavidus sp.]